MSRLLVITQPALVPGFQLAGVDAFGAPDVETAEELIQEWLAQGERGLLAIDEEILRSMDAQVVARLDAAEQLPYLAIPGGGSSDQPVTRQQRLATMLRRAIGFHITFKGSEADSE